MRKCHICGKPYEIKQLKFGNTNLKEIQVSTCDCEEKEYERQQRYKEQQEKKDNIRIKTEKLKQQLGCPLITPMFSEKTFEKIETINKNWTNEYNQNFNACKIYSKTFESKQSKGIFMIGNTGAGKTTLQACIIKELEKQGKICLLIQFSALLDLFIQACDFNSEISIMQIYNTLTKFDYICLDDIGREKYTEKRLEIAFRIVDTLMNNKVTISVTANPECINKLSIIPDFKAIIDRFRYLCPIEMTFHNNSYR